MGALHVLAANPYAKSDAVQVCYDANESAATTRDNFGRILPQSAILKNRMLPLKDSLTYLQQLDAASFTDDDSNSATSLAIQYNMSEEIKFYLHCLHPAFRSHNPVM
jgi:hypothetical protein